MSHCMFGYPIRSDDGTFQDFGSWEATLPLTNLQNRHGSQVARSTDAAEANTKIRHDLGAPCYVGVVALPFHNLSLAGEVVVAGRNSETIAMEAMTVTNLTAEYFARLYKDSDVSITAPANWDPNTLLFEIWCKPSWDYDDGEAHSLFQAYVTASNYIWVFKSSGDVLTARVRVGGVSYNAELTPSWSAGDEVCIGVYLNAGTLTLRQDTNDDGTMETDSVGSVPSFAGLSFTYFVGTDSAGNFPFDGGLNIAILNIGSSADPITDRYNAGDGMDVKEWLATIHPDSGLPLSEHLVSYLPKSDDGLEVKNINFDGETYLDQSGANGGYATVPDAPSLDVLGDLEFQFGGEKDLWTGAAQTERLAEKEQFPAQMAFNCSLLASGIPFFEWSADGTVIRTHTATAAVSFSDGTIGYIKVEHDVDNGAGGVTTTFKTSTDLISWTPLGTPITSAGTSSIHNSTGKVGIGGRSRTAGGNAFTGKIHRAIIKDGIDGTTVLDADFTHRYTGIGSFIEASAYAHTVTVNGTAEVVLDPDHASQLVTNGGFEEYTEEGQYDLNGSSDFITHGNYSALDGVGSFAFEFVLTPGTYTSENVLFERGVFATDGQVLIALNNGNHFYVYVPSSAGDTTARNQYSAFVTDGVPTRIRVVYDGSEADNATRIKVYRSTFDAATGIWGALSQVAYTATTGTIGATLLTPSTGTTLTMGRRAGAAASYLEGQVDRFGLHAGSIPAAKTIYEDGSGLYDIWCEYEGDATNAGLGGATYDGSVTGATQVADGRQPVGWQVTYGTYEFDRATGANQVAGGTYGLRQKGFLGSTQTRNSPQASVTEGRWYAASVAGRETAGSAYMQLKDGAGFDVTQRVDLTTQASMLNVSLVAQADHTVVNQQWYQIMLSGEGAEAYFDDARLYELAEPAFITEDAGWPYYSGWLPAIPDVYPADMPQWEVPASRDGSLQQAEYDAGYVPIFIHIPSSPVTARYWAVLIKDTGNSDGYVEAGRLIIASTYQPSINMAAGAEIGWIAGAKRIVGPSGATFYIDAENRRRMAFAFKTVDLDEAMVHGFEMQRALGTSGQLFWIFDPESTYNMHRWSFLAVLEKLSPLAMPYISEAEEPWELIEEL